MHIAQNKLLSEKLTDKILSLMREGVVVLDGNGLVRLLNRSALTIFDYEEISQISGQPFTKLFCNSKEVSDLLFRLETEKEMLNQKVTFFRKTGEQMICTLSASVVEDEIEGDCLKVIIIQNITEQLKANQELKAYSSKLEKSNKELDEFAYIVSHDLKAPLRAISNLSQWLYEDLQPKLTDDERRNLDILKNRTLRMESLITAVLEYSKVGKVEVQPQLTNIRIFLDEVIELLAPPAHVIFQIGSSLPTIVAPRFMILQLFSNLITNAIKHNDKPQVVIKINAVTKGDFFEFSVEDNGPGISEEFHEKVFALFQTLQPYDKIESTGIGLAIVKKIIEELGGTIWIESPRDGGTKFVFRLPKLTTLYDTIL